MKVDDSCCDISQWPSESGAKQTAPDPRTKKWTDDPKKWRCYVSERVSVPHSYTRNFFGCENGVLQANEGCAPAGTSMGHGYPMNETFAMDQFIDGDSESCGCDELAYQGEGCFVAMTSYIAGVGADLTANFLKLAGTCPAHHSDQSSSGRPWHPPNRDCPAPPARSNAVNPLLQYLVVMDPSQIKDYQPQCQSGFMDVNSGTKMPDSCCDADAWKGIPTLFPMPADTFHKAGEEKNYACYVYPGAGTPFPTEMLRNYIGCEKGKLVASENCVPRTVTYITEAEFESGDYTYPMNQTFGATQWQDGTADDCGCSPDQHRFHGPGCFVAAATLAHFGGMYPGVFVKIDGTCPGAVDA